MEEFAERGFLLLPRVVPPDAVAAAAARAIDELIEREPPTAAVRGPYNYFPEAPQAPELAALLTGSPAFGLAESLTGPGTLEVPWQVQVALNIPPNPHQPGMHHIDGFPPEPDGRPGTFTMLAGVLMSGAGRRHHPAADALRGPVADHHGRPGPGPRGPGGRRGRGARDVRSRHGQRRRPGPALRLADRPRPQDRLPVVGPDDDAVLLYSSGTTGLPKGVPLSHRNPVASLCQMRAVHRAGADDVVLTVLPLYHIFALQVTLSLGLAAGATVVTMPRFDLEGCCGLVQDYGVTRVEVVPPIVLALARHPAVTGYDLSSLRLITSSGAPLGADVAAECARRLDCRVKQAYGMTEFGGATHMVPDSGGGDASSIGPLLPGTRARVIDCASGLDVGPGQPGEMLIRTPGTMRGYLDNPEATAATIDADGWLHTGDVVVADREGWFTVVDRVKELIKYKGSQVAPAALEAILLAHPAVADAGVIGRPDEEAGEIPTAVVVLRQPAGDPGWPAAS